MALYHTVQPDKVDPTGSDKVTAFENESKNRWMTTLHQLRSSFLSGKTKSYEWRRGQLLSLLKLLDENRNRLCAALKQDLGKSQFESLVMEIDLCRTDLVKCIDNLAKWMQSTKVKTGLLHIFDKVFIEPEPYGAVLIIAPWNYPVQLSLLPLIGSIAAGNCVVLKPSEVAESTASLFKELFPKYFDQECIACVTGGIPETTALLEQRWDYIFYTGSCAVGKIVMKAATEHLTPVTLELGGKCPVYVDDSVDLGHVATRILWAKCANAGQTCIAPDYIMCTKAIQDELIDKMKSTLKMFYPEGPAKSPDYPRIISNRHFKRLLDLMKCSSGNLVLGGDTNETEKYMAPTVISDVQVDDPIMQEEIFGPILPIVPMVNVEEAIEYIRKREKPLALYVFSKNQTLIDRIATSCSSGALSVNDCLMHVTVPGLPFGGVGQSGIGSYHGKYSFDTFTHYRGWFHKHPDREFINEARYPPFNQDKLKKVQFFQNHGKSPKNTNCIIL